jgi:hypothetical protein
MFRWVLLSSSLLELVTVAGAKSILSSSTAAAPGQDITAGTINRWGCVLYTSKQCCGFWYGSGSADPCLRPMDPDPAIFVLDLQDANKKLLSISAYYFLNVHLHDFSEIKSHKEVKVFVLFLLDDRRIRIWSRIWFRICTSD